MTSGALVFDRYLTHDNVPQTVPTAGLGEPNTLPPAFRWYVGGNTGTDASLWTTHGCFPLRLLTTADATTARVLRLGSATLELGPLDASTGDTWFVRAVSAPAPPATCPVSDCTALCYVKEVMARGALVLSLLEQWLSRHPADAFLLTPSYPNAPVSPAGFYPCVSGRNPSVRTQRPGDAEVWSCTPRRIPPAGHRILVAQRSASWLGTAVRRRWP